MRGLAVVAAAGLALLSGCASDEPPPTARPEAGDPTADGEAEVHPAAPEPVREHGAGDPTTDSLLGWKALDPVRDGEEILPGVAILQPSLDASGAASFRVRNGSGSDLPDLILAVLFGVPTGDRTAPFRPCVETVEAPLAMGEERAFRVAFPARDPGGKPDRFRVAAGLPELLAAREGDRYPGTTFLGGLLECVRIDADLVSEAPRVTVGLAERGPVPPALETRLLLARAGSQVWAGPWILLPGPVGEARERSVTWRLPRDVSTAGCSLLLRVREKR